MEGRWSCLGKHISVCGKRTKEKLRIWKKQVDDKNIKIGLMMEDALCRLSGL